MAAESLRKRSDCLLRNPDGSGLVRMEDRKQRFGKSGEVPLRHVGLVAEGIAAGLVDGAEDRGRIVGVHERAGAVVDGLSGEGHVVGVHHSVDEAHPQPVRNERRLPLHHRLQQREIGVSGRKKVGVVAAEGVIGEDSNVLATGPSGHVFERPHPDVAGRDASQNRAGQRRLSEHRLARRHHGQAAARGNAQGVHGLADEVLPEHRSQRRTPVAESRKRRSAGALELDVEAVAPGCDLLAQENRPAVSQHGEITELVPRVRLSYGLRPIRDPVARENGQALVPRQRLDVQPQRLGQRAVQHRQVRLTDRHRAQTRIEDVRQTGIGVVEIPARSIGAIGFVQRHGCHDLPENDPLRGVSSFSFQVSS